jgi:CrcB protein
MRGSVGLRPLRGPAGIAIAAGGAAGATTRWAVLVLWPVGAGFPWPVFAVNVVGCALLGVVLAEESTHPRRRLLLHDFGGIGFCGGLTTFSTVALEVAQFARHERVGLAAVYLVASVVAGIAAAVVGAALLHRVRALDTPLEADP